MSGESVWQQLGRWLVSRLGLPLGWGDALGSLVGGLALLFLFIMPLVTYMIWWLRKLLGWMQSRLGPKHVGWHGLLQTPADAIKLIAKEDIIPTLADRAMFILSPVIVFLAAFLVYVTIPLGPRLVIKDLNVGVVFIAAVSSVTVIGIIVGAWASNNKYALVSAFRSAAQMVSYEVPLVLALLGPVMLAQSFSLGAIVGYQGVNPLDWFVTYQPIAFLVFVGAMLAENNVTPFDIVEAESEIVAGFHVEYSGMKFALFFLAEFANTLTAAILGAILFWGGWHLPFLNVEHLPFPISVLAGLLVLFVKAVIGVTVVFWIRATLPRVRVDQLMDFGWKVLIPVTLVNVVVVGGWVAFEIPPGWLAALNWFLLALLVAYGARKPVPAPDRAPARAGGEVG
jgi:NADH-quinone oxidoreductase subunit H